MNELKVSDVMTHLYVAVHPDSTIHEAAERLARNRISGAPVMDRGQLVGIISESDLVYAFMPPAPVDKGAGMLDLLSMIVGGNLRERDQVRRVSEVMTRSVHRISPEASIWQAASVMERWGVKRLPVVDEEGWVVGVISRADVVKAIARSDGHVERDVREAIEVLGEESFEGLDVEVDDGLVTLSGLADRKTSKELAVEITRRMAGVSGVRDRMHYRVDDEKRLVSVVDPDPRSNWVPTEEPVG